MHPWIHRVVQHLSLPLGLSVPRASPRHAPVKVEPAWTSPAPRLQVLAAPAAASARPVRGPHALAARTVPHRSRPCRLTLDPTQGARAVLSGRCADVCAMLDRLAAQEAAA